jgi:hypothetical protein
MMRVRTSCFLSIVLALSSVAACAPAHPVTDASCVSICRDALADGRVLVWGADPSIQRVLVGWAQERGAQVIDADEVHDAMTLHRLVPEPGQDPDLTLQRLGRLLSADRVLVGTVVRDSHPLTIMYAGYKEGHPRITTVFDPTVTVRSFGVDRPTLYWRVTAKGPAPTFFFESTVTDLAQTALQRVTCEADPENQWADDKGCIRKS